MVCHRSLAPRNNRIREVAAAVTLVFSIPATGWTQASQAAPALASKAAVSLEEVKVTGQFIGSNATELSGSYENPLVESSTGLELTRRETPQSISVIGRQRMNDEGVETLDDALTRATGISARMQDVGGRMNYRARGYDISNVTVDNARINFQAGRDNFSSTSAALDMNLYDRIEVLRGANGLLGNTGDPSAVINLKRKEAFKTPFRIVSTSLGNWQRKQAMLDINQPFTDDGRLRGRFVISGQDSHYFRDREKYTGLGLLANFTWDLTPDTTLGFGASHEEKTTKGASSGPNSTIWFADGGLTGFPRSMSNAADWSRSDLEQDTVFASLTHQFPNRWRTKFAIASTRSSADMHLGNSKAFVPRGGGGYWSRDGSGAILTTNILEREDKLTTFQWSLSGPWQAWGQTHEFMVGINGYEINNTRFGLACHREDGSAIPCVVRSGMIRVGDWRDFIATGNTPYYHSKRTGDDSSDRIKTYGGYVANRFKISDPLSVIVGARLAWQRTFTDGKLNSKFSHEITPYLGAVYDINDNYSAYASYTNVFEAQNQRQVSGKYLDPKTGRAFEMGLKGEWLGGLIDGSLALFHTKQHKLAARDLDENGEPRYVFNDDQEGVAFVNAGSGVTTKGFEVDFSGQVTSNWNIYGGYTYLHSHNPNPNANAPGPGGSFSNDPRHVLRFNTTYRLTGSLNKLTLGAGVTAQSKIEQTASARTHPVMGANTDITLKPYTLFNLMARYEFNKNLIGTINVNNVFDKHYWREYGEYLAGIYGEPRSIRVNMRYRF